MVKPTVAKAAHYSSSINKIVNVVVNKFYMVKHTKLRLRN